MYQSVKGTDTFWKVRGLVDGFNKLRRQIKFGAKKIVDESMSAIHFQITPKGDLPYYSYIFSMPDPLGTDIQNVACFRF